MDKSRFSGVLLAITGILLFSSKAVIVKLAYLYGIDTLSLLLLRMVFSMPFYLLIAIFTRKENNTSPSRTDYVWLLVMGCAGYYLSSFFDFSGLQYIKASLERLILFIYPTLVLLISYLVFRQKISSNQVFGVVVTYAGIFIIFFNELALGDDRKILLGTALIFLSALTYAGYLVGSGWLIPKFGAKHFTSYAMLVSAGCVILHYLIVSDLTLFDYPGEVYLLGLAMAIFATVIPSYLISYAIQQLGASQFSIFGSLGPVSTILLAYFFLDESLTWLQVAGAAVVIAGVLLAEKKVRTPRG